VSVYAHDELLTEKQWSSQVYDLCRLMGWKRYHTYFSKRSPAGFPDETLVRDRVVFLELKTETGKVSPHQKEWLTALLNAGAEVYIARPRDFTGLADVLRSRHRVETLLAQRTRTELDLANAPP
jgi:hypothetical protein